MIPVRSLALGSALCALGASPALADDIGPRGDVAFAFPDGYGDLPLPVSPDRVLTVAIERQGDVLRGVILLTDGRLIHFDGGRTQPLTAPPVDAFAATGK